MGVTWQSVGIDPDELNDEGETRLTCPKCSDTRQKSWDQCLSVNKAEGVFHCFHCNWNGRIGRNYTSSRPWRKKEYRKPHYTFKGDIPEEVVAWFRARGITKDVLIKRHITWGPAVHPVDDDGKPLMNPKDVPYDERTPGVRFPFTWRGQVVNFKARTIAGLGGEPSSQGKRFASVRGARVLPFGMDYLDRANTIIVEGEIDALTLNTLGIWNVISVPNGAQGMDWIDDLWDTELQFVRHWTLMLDNDEKGKVYEAELARRLGKERCRRVAYPAGCKDANEVLTKLGADALRGMLLEARPYPVEGLFKAYDILPDLTDLYEYGLEPGISLGIPGLDDLYTIGTGAWTVVTGIPGEGKSEIVDQFAVNLVVNQGWKILYWSPENDPTKRHLAKLMEKYTGLPFGTGPNTRMSREAFEQTAHWLDEHFTFANPEDTTLDHLLDLVEQAVSRDGIKGAVFDPWTYISPDKTLMRYGEARWVSECLKKIKRKVRDLDIHLWLVAHPTKLQRGKNGKTPIPRLYDVSGSAAWFNMTDYGIVVHRDKEATSMPGARQLVNVIVAKVRWKHHGTTGTIVLEWNKLNGRFSSTNQAPTYDPTVTDEELFEPEETQDGPEF
jgi:twinkle protein